MSTYQIVRSNTATGVLEGRLFPRMNSAFSDVELCLLGGRKEGVGGQIRNFDFSGACGFSVGTLGNGQGPLSSSAFNAGVIKFTNTPALKNGTLSGVAVFEMPTLMDNGCIFSTSYSASESGDNGFILCTLANGRVYMAIHINPADLMDAVLVVSAVGSVKAGQPNTVSWSYNKTTGFAQLCVNNVYSSATSIRATDTVRTIGAMGGYYDLNASVGAGKKIFYLNAVWGYDVSPSRVVSLCADPWRIFEIKRTLFSLSSGALLVVHGLTQTQTLGSPTLSAAGTLSVAGAEQAQNLGTVALIQQNILEAAGLTQTQSLGSPELSTGLTLSVSGTSQAQQLSTIALIQQSTLSVGNLAQSQQLDHLSLSQANVIAINGIVQSQELGTVALSTTAVIAANSIISQQALESIALTQASILVTQAIEQGQSLSSIALVQNSVLIVNDVLHNQLLSGVLVHEGVVPLRVRGSTVFIYASGNVPVFVVSSNSDVLL